ncbi:MAG: HAMP domain-containing protein [Anaerolineales bacterium]
MTNAAMNSNAEAAPAKRSGLYLSLRFKLLLLFIALFAIAIVAAYFWFVDFATALAREDLEEDLLAVAETTAEEVARVAAPNEDDLLIPIHQELADIGPDATLNAQYVRINEILRQAKANNPEAAGMYTYVTYPDEAYAGDAIAFAISAGVPVYTEEDPETGENVPVRVAFDDEIGEPVIEGETEDGIPIYETSPTGQYIAVNRQGEYLPGAIITNRDLAIIAARPEGCNVDPISVPRTGFILTRLGLETEVPDLYDVAVGGWDDIFIDGALRGLEEPAVTEEIYTDEFGTWLSAFAPIVGQDGQVYGAVGLDACAIEIEQIEQDIQEQALTALVLASIALTGVVVVSAYSITRPIQNLTQIAEQIGQGNYDQDKELANLANIPFRDEVAKLADVFTGMVEKVAQREESLKKKVASLQIIIDENKLDKEVEDIVDNDFFRDIQAKAANLRSQRQANDEARRAAREGDAPKDDETSDEDDS